ncbi:hypothetical protein Y88_2236 [Novosphingobium nitrogenifigens DSM 19370]|uniref:Alpha/beta hydrolase n=1 Tax=Novosphingobium nitrogenifigens DSM 19370 TaxID=983920 RepID=F1Z617_9SPHN|nr:hypothetical protein [Novosphingobium nitrogenifigens]EGD59799.1 hypothetical protein Y88_2236 [Novosphingobium nitrogenifigens DSM 19370]
MLPMRRHAFLAPLALAASLVGVPVDARVPEATTSAATTHATAAHPTPTRTTTTRTWTDASGVRWTETRTVETGTSAGADRMVETSDQPRVKGIARFGPFVVIDAGHAALVDATDETSPARFAGMLHAFPGIRVLEMIDCPGTFDDTANLRLGRMIHASGIATDIPTGGSVRSGAVELFLAGVTRHAAPDAEFAVHAWEDDAGHGPRDFAPDAPVNRAYLDYYRAMGMTPEHAGAFYALTNSVPNAGVLWLHVADIARYVPLD